jgi:hypothetical protein
MFTPRRSISLTLIPLLAMLLALLGDPVGESTQAAGSTEHAAFVASINSSMPAECEARGQQGLPVGATPAPMTGRLRVREADRLGPTRLHLPPPTV